MRIGIIGTGNIGKTLARKLRAAGTHVKVANSRGPETIDADVLGSGHGRPPRPKPSRASDVVILSIPLHRIPIAREPARRRTAGRGRGHRHLELLSARDGKIDAIERGPGREPVGGRATGPADRQSLECGAGRHPPGQRRPAGTPGRIAIPVAADSDEAKRVGMKLVDETGFDPFDAGSLADSWRQPTGATRLLHRTQESRRWDRRWRRRTAPRPRRGGTWFSNASRLPGDRSRGTTSLNSTGPSLVEPDDDAR